MADDLDDFFEEFDEISRQAEIARYQDFSSVMRRWFAMFEEAPDLIKRRIQWLKGVHPWPANETSITRPNSGVGDSALNWPDSREERLSAQLTLFEEIAERRIRPDSFSSEYFRGSSNNFNDMVQSMARHLFDPFSAELRRYLRRNADTPPPGESEYRRMVPASDRVVTIDHNSSAYAIADAALEDVETKLLQINVGDPEDKERVVAEVSAGRRLLKATKVRVTALLAVIGSALTWIATQFAETAAGQAATWAITKLQELLPTLAGLL